MEPSIDWRQALHLETPRSSIPRPEMSSGTVAALAVLAHPDPDWVGGRIRLRELAAGRPVEISRLAPRFLLDDGEARPLSDPFLSRRPWRLEPRSNGRLRLCPESVEIAVDGEVLSRPRDLEPDALLHGVVLVLAGRVALFLHLHPAAPRPSLPSYGLVGKSHALDLLRQEISRAAPSDVPVLLRGETGTGKELVARALHDHGPRRGGPFVAVNMAAIPSHLAAAELFGAERGAFTGATSRKRGYFGRAAGGTLFLDEIGETPPDVQALLLRALESGEVQRLGSAAPERADVRVIAATDADLDAKIADGAFRAPLLHRLAGYPLALPPLRERREDLGLLLFHFLAEELRAAGQESRLTVCSYDAEPWIGADLVARLAAHEWPGNVRELRNAACRIVAANRGPGPASLPPSSPGAEPPSPRAEAPPPVLRRKPSEVSDEEIVAALAAEDWNVKAAAASLGISRGSLYLRLESIPGLRKAADLGCEEIEQSRIRHGGDLRAMAAALRVSAAGLEQRMRKLQMEL